MFLIQAPYPLLKTTVLMPSPRQGNQKNLAASIQTLRAMDGTLYTYVKTKRARRVFQWEFLGTKEKAQEIAEFIKLYSGELVSVTDHNENKYLGYVTINPLELSGAGPAKGYPSGEVYIWNISLEEKV